MIHKIYLSKQWLLNNDYLLALPLNNPVAFPAFSITMTVKVAWDKSITKIFSLYIESILSCNRLEILFVYSNVCLGLFHIPETILEKRNVVNTSVLAAISCILFLMNLLTILIAEESFTTQRWKGEGRILYVLKNKRGLTLTRWMFESASSKSSPKQCKQLILPWVTHRTTQRFLIVASQIVSHEFKKNKKTSRSINWSNSLVEKLSHNIHEKLLTPFATPQTVLAGDPIQVSDGEQVLTNTWEGRLPSFWTNLKHKSKSLC